MRSDLKIFLKWVIIMALGLYAACSTEPEHKNVITPTAGSGGVTGSGGSNTGGTTSTAGFGGSRRLLAYISRPNLLFPFVRNNIAESN